MTAENRNVPETPETEECHQRGRALVDFYEGFGQSLAGNETDRIRELGAQIVVDIEVLFEDNGLDLAAVLEDMGLYLSTGA